MYHRKWDFLIGAPTSVLFLSIVFFLGGCISSSKEKADKAVLHLDLGNSHLQAGSYPLALKSLLDAEKLDSNNFRIHHSLGLVYFARDRHDLSEKHFRTALRLNPQATSTRNELANLLINRKRFKEAEALLKESESDLTYPEPGRTYYLLGVLFFEMNRYSEAIGHLERSIKYSNSDCFSLNYYGRSLFSLERYKEAARVLDQAVGLCQQSSFDEPHYYSALTYYRLGDVEKSRARFEELTRFYPSGKYLDRARSMISILYKVKSE
jgi:type IV pilus assembly protein PilF